MNYFYKLVYIYSAYNNIRNIISINILSIFLYIICVKTKDKIYLLILNVMFGLYIHHHILM